MKINVTKKDIGYGIKYSVADELAKYFRRGLFRVDSKKSSTQLAQDRIDDFWSAFDSGKPVKPFSFEIEGL